MVTTALGTRLLEGRNCVWTKTFREVMGRIELRTLRKKKKKQTKQRGQGKSFADMMKAFLASIKAGKSAAQLPTGVYDFDPWGASISGQRDELIR